jgi:ATP-binding cassette, subfamily B, bacterial MsbA
MHVKFLWDLSILIRTAIAGLSPGMLLHLMKPNPLIFQFVSRYPKLIGLTVILGFSGAVFNGVSTALIIPVIFGFLGQDIGMKGMPPILQQILSSSADGLPSHHRYFAMMGVVLLAIVLKNLASYASSIVSSRLSQTLTRQIRQDGMRMLLDVDLEYFSKNKLGDIMSQLGGETSRAAEAIRVTTTLFTICITILVFTSFLLAISWQLTIATTVLLGLASLTNQFLIKRARRNGERLSEQSRSYSIMQQEILSGIRLVKATGNEDIEFNNLSALIEAREAAELASQATFAIVPPLNEIAGIITVLAIVILGKLWFGAQPGTLSTVLLTYLLVLFRLLPFISQLNSQRSNLANAAPSVQVVADFLRRDTKPVMARGMAKYSGIQDAIKFTDLAFRYPGNEDWTLQGVNLTLPKGTTLALVGSSGAGKSTLADLLPRFYDCAMGGISIDDRDIREFDLRSLRQAMGIVSQDTFLFNDTVANNIAYGVENSTREAVIEAARRANAYQFISELPQGFDTTIGDRGVLLSGGQRQRLAIARALLKNPEILILDEATSALDTVSERIVQQAIDELSRDRTVLVIAHRLSTIQNADQIAVFDKGRVVEVGTHRELLSKRGVYANLYRMQFGDSLMQTVR